jgi:hypothetical protein
MRRDHRGAWQCLNLPPAFIHSITLPLLTRNSVLAEAPESGSMQQVTYIL